MLRHPSPDGRVRIYLAEGTLLRLGGVQLLVRYYDVAIIGGNGATIDAQGLSRHFQVSRSGTLHLENVHLTGGGFEMIGASILVRDGSVLTANNVTITDAKAISTVTTVCTCARRVAATVRTHLTQSTRLAVWRGDCCIES